MRILRNKTLHMIFQLLHYIYLVLTYLCIIYFICLVNVLSLASVY